AVGLAGQHGAGFHRPAVHVHDAGAALAGVAADMGPREVEVIAQKMDQQRAVLDLDSNGLAVHRQFDCRHVIPPECLSLFQLETARTELCNWDFAHRASWKGHCERCRRRAIRPRCSVPPPSVARPCKELSKTISASSTARSTTLRAAPVFDVELLAPRCSLCCLV